MSCWMPLGKLWPNPARLVHHRHRHLQVLRSAAPATSPPSATR
jgi:hypothetical protein